jgi:hypothetical protein
VESGPLAFTGKRLWGVAYDAEGNEREVIFRHYGSGSASSNYPPGSDASDSSLASVSLASAWGIYVDEELLVEVPRTFDSAGTVESNYVTVHDLDARFKMATVERLTMQGTSPSGAHSPTTVVECTFDGAVVFTQPVPMPAAATPTATGFWRIWGISNVISGGMCYLVSNAFVTFPSSAEARASKICCSVPQVTDWYGENWYEAWYQYNDFLTSRHSAPHLKGYPNQISDALLMIFGYGFHFILNYGLWVQYGPDEDNDHRRLSEYPALDFYLRDLVTDGDGSGGGRRLRGFAKKTHTIDHHVIATKNTYFRGFANMLLKMRELFLGEAAVVVDPIMSAGVYIRPAPTDEVPTPVYVRHDLLEPMADKIDAEVGLGTVDRPTLRIDPVRVI